MAAGNGIRVDVRGDFKAIDRDLRIMHPQIVRKAQVAAINNIARTIRTKAIKNVALASRLPDSGQFNGKKYFGRRTRTKGAKYNHLEATITMSLHPVAAGLLDPSISRTAGVSAAGHSWAPGFGGKIKMGRSKGKVSVWQRKGKASLPIKRLTVPISQHGKVLGTTGDRIMATKFKRTLERALATRLKKYAGTN